MHTGRWRRDGGFTIALLGALSCATPRAEPAPPTAPEAPAVDTSRDVAAPDSAPPMAATPPVDAAVAAAPDAAPKEDLAAIARVQAMLAALPARRLKEREVCARLKARGLVVPRVVFTHDDTGALHLVSPDDRGSPVVLPCDRSAPKGLWSPDPEWTPVLTCDAKLPKCDFAWVSGGKAGTPIPPTERTYWFDTAGGALRLVAVEVSAYQ
jgi:hypothetical protein